MSLRPPLTRIICAALGALLGAQIATARAQDVRAHCAQAGNDDRVQPLPAPLVAQARRLFGMTSEADDSYVQTSTTYRCMGGKVWLCNYGANLVCDKANVSRSSPGAASFCRENPGADSVPMAATGHDTIYSWTCVGAKARIAGQSLHVDARGFIAENWKRLDE